jgi:SAM-dependent methyltransferase
MNLAESLFINSTFRARELRNDVGPRVLGLAEPEGVDRVLEIGCGQGVGFDLISERFPSARVIGIDVDPRMIRRAQRRLGPSRAAEVRVADVCSLPFENESFDVVVDFAAVHHVPDWQRALPEIARVLRPQGLFLFEDHDVAGHSWFARTFFAHPDDRFTASEFVAALEESGVVVATVDDRGGHFVGCGSKRGDG